MSLSALYLSASAGFFALVGLDALFRMLSGCMCVFVYIFPTSLYVSAHAKICTRVYIDNLQECACVFASEDLGSPAGLHLLGPDQTMRREVARCGADSSGG